MNIDIDTSVFEVVELISYDDNVSCNSYSYGRVRLSSQKGNFNTKKTIAGIVLKVRDTVTGEGHITVNPSSTYKDNSGKQYYFTEGIGITSTSRIPDMNNDKEVKLDDLTVIALLEGTEINNEKYHEKFDIDGSKKIDVPDIEYIKEWTLQEKKPYESQLTKFREKFTRSAYEHSSKEAERIITYEYDKAGNIIKETDANGNSLEYTYDQNNRVICIKDKENNKHRVFYDEAGNVIKEVSPENYDESKDDGPGTSYEYDTMGRVVKVIDAENNVVQKNVYDISGQLIKAIDAKGYLSGDDDNSRYGVEYIYDIGNRIKIIVTPESKLNKKLSTVYTYDALNNLLSIKDGKGNITKFERDDWGRLQK